MSSDKRPAELIGTSVRFVYYNNSNICFAYFQGRFAESLTWLPCERISPRDVRERVYLVNGAGYVSRPREGLVFDSNGRLVPVPPFPVGSK